MINTDRIVTHEPRCAASPWNYDMDSAPRDGTRVLLAWECDGEVYVDVFHYRREKWSKFVWWNRSEFLYETEPFAWSINLPEVLK